MDTHTLSRNTLGLWLGLIGAACAAQPARPPTSGDLPAPLIHTVTASPAGISVNAYLIESAHGVVAIDSALTVSDARALVARLDALHKPLLAVLLTHGHPDHYNGVAALIAGRGDVPIYATRAVAEVIRSSDAAKEAQWKPMFGAEWPAPRTFPNHELDDGATLRFDDLRFRVHALGPGESHADSTWTLEGDEKQVFLGDVVLHGEHAYVSDGHTSAWLATLRRLRQDLGEVGTLYPGHGTPGGLELLDYQVGYLEAYRAEVDALRQGQRQLSEDAKATLTQRMKTRYPEAGIDFLIALGADAVANELANEQ